MRRLSLFASSLLHFVSHRSQQQKSYPLTSGFTIVHMQYHSLANYLEDTLDVLQDSKTSFTVSLNDSHRKSMIRNLLGITRVTMNEELLMLRQKLSWAKAKDFTRTKLSYLEVPVDAAPHFQHGVENYESFEISSKKLFAFLARGRTYQGKLDRLLQDICPDLLIEYESIVAEVDETELLKIYAREKCAGDSDLYDSLVHCAEKEFPKALHQPKDGGKKSGVQGEVSLKEFLNDPQIGSSFELLAPVWIRNKNGKAISKRCPHVIELSPPIDLDGMTTEFDATLVQQKSDGIHIAQVWEAKAALEPTILHNILTKNYRAMTTVFGHPAELISNGKRHLLPKREMPKLGIYATRLLDINQAARRSIIVCAEFLIENDPSIIPEALQSGTIEVPREKVQEHVEFTLKLVEEVQPDFMSPSSF
mmetsp:Transcript_20199/g.29978  ORF Transcript_20199/g.29978 Transcript_20199/m.29978 type:complete len:420 (-) Transcript_20199:147-1406(-)